MGSNVDKYLEPTEHALVDHTGIPGVGGGPATIVGAVVIETDFEFATGSLSTKTIPSATLTVDNQVLAVKFHCESGDGGIPTLTVAFDGNTVLTHTFAANGREAQVHLWLVRTGVTTCRASAAIIEAGGGSNSGSASFTLDWSLARDITFTFAGGANENHRFYQALKWPEAGSLGVVGIGSDTLPTGVIVSYGGSIASVPTGFLPCDGSLADQTVESELFAAIGTNWNIGGEPGGFFRLPDLRAKTISGINDGTLPAGIDGGFTTRSVADLAGAETHGHSGSVSGAHSHTIPIHSHTITNQADHNHGATGEALVGPVAAGAGLISSPSQIRHTHTTSSAGAHDHTGTTGVDSTDTDTVVDHSHSITTGDSLEPTVFCPYIIKSRQVGGGIGTTAQNNGGSLIGPQPTFNFIPSGLVGLGIVEDVGNNRVDVTITGSSLAQVSAPEITAGTEAALRSFSPLDVAAMAGIHGVLVQRVREPMSAFLDIDQHTTLPADNTIPQDDEGAFIVSAVITPKKIGNKIIVRAVVQFDGLGDGGVYTAALFEAGSVNAFAALGTNRGANNFRNISVEGEFTAPALTALTFSLRLGTDSAFDTGNPTVNGPVANSPVGVYGGVAATWIELLEYNS